MRARIVQDRVEGRFLFGGSIDSNKPAFFEMQSQIAWRLDHIILKRAIENKDSTCCVFDRRDKCFSPRQISPCSQWDDSGASNRRPKQAANLKVKFERSFGGSVDT